MRPAKPKRTADEIEFLRTFGRRVEKRRKKLEFSQEAMADEAKLDRSYMSGIERGTRNISLLKLRLLAKALKVPLRSLLGD